MTSRQTSSSNTPTNAKDAVSQILSTKCQKCSSRIIQNEKDVTRLGQAWLQGKRTFSSLVTCNKCSTKTCMGCGSKTAGKQPISKVSVRGIEMSFCCSLGRLFLLWVWLCGYDEHFCSCKREEAAKANSSRRHAGGGTGYEQEDYERYYDFGGPGRGRRHNPQEAAANQKKMQAETTQQRLDRLTTSVLLGLKEILPSQEKAKKNPQPTFDVKPPEAVAYFLLNSKILDRAGELLRNDFLEDVTKRKDVYLALIDILRLIANYPTIATKTIYSERHTSESRGTLASVSFPRGSGSAQPKMEKVSSLIDILHNLDLQCKMMLKVARNSEREFRDHDGQTMLSLCRKISDLSDSLKAKSGGKSSTTAHKPEENNDHFIVEIDDQQILSTFHYARKAQQLGNSRPGRIKRLITEITSLKTGLPLGIFVKYASSRPDCMKIVIVGPSDTPYENGLFEFDLFCPSNYPFEPPGVWFKGTDGGKVEINPNLHADGLVCLSLLGTWPGEPWRPAQSTLLQVLISIQAMIFSPNPIANEPSQEYLGTNNPHIRHSFNDGIRHETIRLGMLAWLQNPPRLWREVVAAHFKKNAEGIIRMVRRWEQNAGSNVGGVNMRSGVLPCSRGAIGEQRRRLQNALQQCGYVSGAQVSQAPTPSRSGGGGGGGGGGAAYGRSRYGYGSGYGPY